MFRKTKYINISLLFIFSFSAAKAQTKYWVFFKDKEVEKPFDPYMYFDKNALERREISNLQIYDFTDLPVNEKYVSALASIADSLGNTSRWFNAKGVWASENQVKEIAKLPFVKAVKRMTINLQPAEKIAIADLPTTDSLLLWLQTERMQGSQFQNKNITGDKVRIAVLDVGFRGVDTHPAFKRLRSLGKIILTQDFIKNNPFVYDFGTHGTMVLSCIAGFYQDSIPMGLATDAEFLLARTERGLTEWRDEEDSWVAAAEWADKNGAKIISSSLGYTYKRYFYRDMDGETSLIARAANIAARKGMLVITAAGNDGKSDWKYICTPGDADSALTIGGTDPKTNYHISFSSYGPAADETMKPNVSAPGQTFVADSKDFSQAFGTSFSTPLVAGFAACAWQINPQMTNMQLFREIEKSASLYPYFDYAHGFGIPQANYFINKKSENGIPPVPDKTFTILADSENIDINLKERYFGDSLKTEVLRDKKLYYHLADAQGKVLKYYVIQPEEQKVVSLKKTDLPADGTLRVHFDGYTEEFNY